MSQTKINPVKIAIIGCAGRMGRALLAQVHDTPGAAVCGGVEAAGAPEIGTDLGLLAGQPAPWGMVAGTDALEVMAGADAVIDFTTPETSVEIAGLAAQARIVHVIGTTGWTAAQESALSAAARHATLIKSGNMSLGVNLLAGLVRQVGATLGTDWDIEIVEMHHRHKVDAPSGTALLLGEAAAEGRGVALASVAARGRDGITGPRKDGEIGFAALRGGSVVGAHKVIFATEGERLELSHIAEDRVIFARGAVTAALWGHGKGPGLYSLNDVLGL